MVCHQATKCVRVSLQGFSDQHCLKVAGQLFSQAVSGCPLCYAPEVHVQLCLQARYAGSVVAAQVPQLPVLCIVLKRNLHTFQSLNPKSQHHMNG